MVIYLPGQSVDEEPLLDELTPREIVRELDSLYAAQRLSRSEDGRYVLKNNVK